MIVFCFGLTAVMLVALLSRDHDITASQETIVTAELHLGASALEVLPDHVRLTPRRLGEFEHRDRVLMAREALASEGFANAGAYGLDELPASRVLLMTNARDAMSATVYEHAQAGVWIEIVSCYDDGHRIRHSTLAGRGLDTRPGNVLVSLPGVRVADLLARARGDRSAEGLVRPARDGAKARFEQDYALWVAARKQNAWTEDDAERADDEPMAA